MDKGGRIYLAGCGATGRLALSLETLFRQQHHTDRVIGFMAGGDYALIRAVESFEDNTDFGVRQLLQLGFCENDLLIGITEGGETSFVIGATNEAARISPYGAYFVYCNPDDELKHIARSNEVLENDKITKLNLTVGPMAISGSTRMQATTVQFIAVGFALLKKHNDFAAFKCEYEEFIDELKKQDFSFLASFIKEEAHIYQNKGIVTYESDAKHAISILTDTTERAPTFNLHSFETSEKEQMSLCYLAVKDTQDSQQAWESLLKRKPRGIKWDYLQCDISDKEIYRFDISENAITRREKLAEHQVFSLEINRQSDLYLCFGTLKHKYKLSLKDPLFEHLTLKLLLNIHSTLVMGLLGRFEGNMMTFVKPRNFKLVNRAARYIKELLTQQNTQVDETKILEQIFKHLDEQDKAIVLTVVQEIKKKAHTDARAKSSK